MLEFVPECHEIQKMCDKAVNNYLSTIKFVRECPITQEMFNKAVNRYFFVFDSVLNQ